MLDWRCIGGWVMDADWIDWFELAAKQVVSGTPPQPSTAVPQEQVDLTWQLKRLHDFLPTFYRRIVLGEIERGEWAMLAKVLTAFANQCSKQEPPEQVDEGG